MITALSGPLVGRGGLAGGDLEEAYAIGSPSVRVNLIVALDGAVEVGGRSAQLGGPADREILATQRAISDVVLVGAATVRSENYGPAWLDADRRQRRAERDQPPLPAIAVVTSAGDLDPDARLFGERRADQPEPPRPYVFTTAALPEARRLDLAEVADLVVLEGDSAGGAAGPDMAAIVSALRADGHGRVLCEGGPSLFRELVEADLVDELCLTHAPVLGGPGSRVLAGGGATKPWAEPVPFAAVQFLTGDGMLFARYRPLRQGQRSEP